MKTKKFIVIYNLKFVYLNLITSIKQNYYFFSLCEFLYIETKRSAFTKRNKIIFGDLIGYIPNPIKVFLNYNPVIHF